MVTRHDLENGARASAVADATVTLVNLNLIRVPAIAPYALDVLASALVADGHVVEILDLCRVDDPVAAIRHYFGSRQPHLVGLSMRNAFDLYFPSMFHLPHKGSFLESHQRLIDAIKEHVAVDRIVIGGVGFSLNPTAFLARFGLRFGVRGPGETILCHLARQAVSRGGLSALAEEGGVKVFDGRGTLGTTVVSRRYVDNAWYYDYGGQAAIRTSAGCAMHCSYCAEPSAVGHAYRRVVPAHSLEELDQLIASGIRDIQTADSEFNMPLAHSQGWLDRVIERHYGRDVRLWLYCQPRPFDRRYAAKLAKAGVAGINFGTDHTDPDVLASLGKWYGKPEIIATSRFCDDEGIAVMHELLFGAPGDTPDRMLRAVDDITALTPRVVGVTLGLGVSPGTPLGHLLEDRLKTNMPGPGFYCAGEPFVDPTFYLDPAFELSTVFERLRRHVGSAPNVMLPSLDSTSAANNQLVNSERVRQQTVFERRKGPSWYHFPDTAAPSDPDRLSSVT